MVSATTWARVLPPSVVVVDGAIGDDVESLLPEERAEIRLAVPKRRREYAAARANAHRALARLGVAHGPLLSDRDRVPRWPDGIVGSISHMDGWTASAVARASELRAVGIDLEPDEALAPNLWRLVATDRERAWLERQSSESRGRAARLLFSAKEAFYKCQFPLSRTLLDFRDVELDVALERGEFRATLVRSAGPWLRGATFDGRHAAESGVLVTAMAWPATLDALSGREPSR